MKNLVTLRFLRFATALVVLVVSATRSAPAGAQSLPVPIPPVDDPLLRNLTIAANASTLGMWSAQVSWPLVAIHVAVLPDGTVVSYGTPLGQGVQDGRVFDRWDPLGGFGSHVTLPNSQGVNSFCSAGVLLSNGELLVSGGNAPLDSTRFDFTDGSATTEASRLASNRWYATMTMLADGRALITGGSVPYATQAYADPNANLGNVSQTPELYTPGTGWRSLFGANSRDAFGPDYNRWWYPRQWVAPNGQVFGISSEKMWYLNPSGDGTIRTVGTFKGPANNTTRPNIGPTCSAVMYDVGRILQIGGNGYTNGYASNSSAQATIFDIRNGDPIVTEIAPMQYARQWANTTVLPTGEVLVTGGTQFADNGGADAVYAAEIWDPVANDWDTMASAAVIRNYHSSTILLPNGVVFSAGGGVPGPVTNLNAEVYYPPYLFQTIAGQQVLADRPRLLSISSKRFNHNADFQVELADGRLISDVAMIGLSSTTHSFNMGQRYYPAAFTQSDGLLTVTTPANANLAPPGYYLLFVIDSAGVPSRGEIFALDVPNCTSNAQCDDSDPCTNDVCSAGQCSHADSCPGSSDPVAWLPFDDGSGTSAHDISGNQNNGTLVGGATFTTGQAGGAVSIAGGTQHVDLPNGLVQQCTDLTVATWVRLTTNPVWGRIFDFGTDANTNMFLTAAAGNASTLRFAIKTPGINGGAEAQISYNYTFPLNTWTHVAVVLQGNTGYLYVNGVQVATNANILANPNNLGATANDWLGRSQYAADPYLNGALDEFQVSCRAYSAQEISALAVPGTGACSSNAQCNDNNACTADVCTNGVCTHSVICGGSSDPVAWYPFDDGSGTSAADISGNANTGLLVNGASFATGQSAGAVSIAGGTQHVDLPNNLVQQCNDLTVATWVNLASNPVWGRIFDFGTDTNTNMFLTPAAGNTSTLRFAIKAPGINGGAEAQISYAYAFPLNTWVHVGVVLEGNTGRLYVNGAQVATNTNVVANPSNLGATVNNWLGRSQWPDPYLNGRLDEFQVSCRAYSAQEMALLATPVGPVCGNGTCQTGESCSTCPADCGACAPVCGNGSCQTGESCSTCPADCGACPPAQLFSDNFAAGLGKWIETGEGDWNTETLHASTGYPASGSNSPAGHADNCDTTCTLTLATPIDLRGRQSATLTFLRFVDNQLDNNEYLRVEVFNGTAWQVLFNWQQNAGGGDDNVWHAHTVNLAPYLGVANFNLRFVTHTSDTSEHVHVDDVVITAQ